jgi:hypothetical protein
MFAEILPAYTKILVLLELQISNDYVHLVKAGERFEAWVVSFLEIRFQVRASSSDSQVRDSQIDGLGAPTYLEFQPSKFQKEKGTKKKLMKKGLPKNKLPKKRLTKAIKRDTKPKFNSKDVIKEKMLTKLKGKKEVRSLMKGY